MVVETAERLYTYAHMLRWREHYPCWGTGE